MSENQIQGGTIVTLPEKKHQVDAKELKDMLLVVIRIRGKVKKPFDIKKTMALLRLHKQNHAVLVKATKDIDGMLFKVKDFIAYGIIDKDTLVALLKKKSKLQGRKPFDVNAMKVLAGYKTYEELADALLTFEIEYSKIKKIMPVFRLHPPKGGFFAGTKVPYSLGGVLGFHGTGINKLLIKMI